MNILEILNPFHLITESINGIVKGCDALFTSDEERLQLKNALEEIKQKPELLKLAAQNLEKEAEFKATIKTIELAIAQNEINLFDSKGNSYQSGWRPSIGYISAISLFFASLLPLATCSIIWCVECFKFWHILPFPMEFKTLTEMLGTNLISLLGLGYLRTREKVKGVQNNH